MMDIRHATNPQDFASYGTERIRGDFLVTDLFIPGQLNLTYSHYDRMILGGAVPLTEPVILDPFDALKTSFFLERRELGVVNIGQLGTVIVDGSEYAIGTLDGLYVGRGAKDVQFVSANPSSPARFYLVSTPAHATYPTVIIRSAEAQSAKLGSPSTSNERTLTRYIHADGAASCQLMLGVTHLHPNNMWNTMPAHLHDRRMEAYLYFGIDADARVFHFMGTPEETRHIVVANEQAVLSPSWSIHSGVGTSNYSFIWAMAGENYDFADMDPVGVSTLR